MRRLRNIVLAFRRRQLFWYFLWYFYSAGAFEFSTLHIVYSYSSSYYINVQHYLYNYCSIHYAAIIQVQYFIFFLLGIALFFGTFYRFLLHADRFSPDNNYYCCPLFAKIKSVFSLVFAFVFYVSAKLRLCIGLVHNEYTLNKLISSLGTRR